MSHLKRKLEEVEGNSDATEPKEKHIKESSSQSLLERLQYPEIGIQKPSKAPPFQYPFQLVSFSYTPERILEFTNSALRYYVDPPLGADLTYRIDNWTRRVEERGRLDGLLKACLHEQAVQERLRASVVSWRGVMTK
jgi:RAT1-interacting protein